MNDDATGHAYLMVHFDPATGAIKQRGFGFAFFDVPGCACGELPEGTNIHEIGEHHRVDLSALKAQGNGRPPLATLIAKLDS